MYRYVPYYRSFPSAPFSFELASTEQPFQALRVHGKQPPGSVGPPPGQLGPVRASDQRPARPLRDRPEAEAPPRRGRDHQEDEAGAGTRSFPESGRWPTGTSSFQTIFPVLSACRGKSHGATKKLFNFLLSVRKLNLVPDLGLSSWASSEFFKFWVSGWKGFLVPYWYL